MTPLHRRPPPRHRAAGALLGLLLASSAVTSTAALADPGPASSPAPLEDARERFKRGVQFYKDGDLRSALVEFEEANRIAPNFRVKYNIGQVYEELQDFANATRALRGYLDEGGKAIPDARRRTVEEDLKRLERHVARIEVEATEPDVAVVIEGERKLDVGKTPIREAVLLNGGAWEVTGRKDGFRPCSERLTVAGGDVRRVVLTLVKADAPVAASEPPRAVEVPPATRAAPSTSPTPSMRSSMTPVWVVVGVTGALAAGAAVTGGLALSANSDYRAKLSTLGSSASDISQANDRAHAFALASDVMTAGAAAGAVVSTVLFLTRRQPAVSVASASVRLDLGPTSVGASGSF